MPQIIAFAEPVEPEFDRPRPDRLVKGNPLRATWNHFTGTFEVLEAVKKHYVIRERQ